MQVTLGQTDSERLDTLLTMLKELSVATSPTQVMNAFTEYYWRLRPTDYLISASTKDLPDGQYRITRQVNIHDVLAGRSVPTRLEAWRRRDLIPVHSGGFIGAMIAGRRPVLIDGMNVPDDAVLGSELADMRSALILPLFDEGQPRYWNMQFRRTPRGFSQQELETAMIIANLAGGNNTRLLLMDEIKKLNQALRQQFEEVAQVQRSLLPHPTPRIPGLEIATSYLTSDQAGGDYYDFIHLPDGRWGIMIADVSGHGAAAATVMAMLHGIIHAYTGTLSTPDDVVRYANRRLLAARIDGTFVTALLAIYDPQTGCLSYARSGHTPPILRVGGSSTVRILEDLGGLPLGIFEPYEIVSESIQLAAGDTVVLYTDGITEAMNASRELFGIERLLAAVAASNGNTDAIVDSIHAALFRHTSSMSRADDQTLVAFRYTGRRA